MDGGWVAIGAEAVVAEHVDEGCGGDAAEPSEKAETVEPGADAVGAVRGGALHFKADLGGVGAEFDPVVDDERAGCQGPDDGEEGEVAELDDHFAEVGGDVVDR